MTKEGWRKSPEFATGPGPCDCRRREAIDLSTKRGADRWKWLVGRPQTVGVSLRVVPDVVVRIAKKDARALVKRLEAVGRPWLLAWPAPEGTVGSLIFCPAKAPGSAQGEPRVLLGEVPGVPLPDGTVPTRGLTGA